jgi:hypothetical protein
MAFNQVGAECHLSPSLAGSGKRADYKTIIDWVISIFILFLATG